MLFVPPTLGGSLQTTVSPSQIDGITVTASASTHTKGSYTNLIDPTLQPSYGILVEIKDVNITATDTSLLVDIAYGPTGGGNEEVICPNLNAGAAVQDNAPGGKKYFFPIYIPTGVRISARCQAVTGSDECKVDVWLFQDPPFASPAGKVTDYGTDLSNSRGTSVTPGAAAWGTWTQLDASLDYDHRFWAVGMDQLGDLTITGSDCPWLVQLGVGPDSGNVSIIAGPFRIQALFTEQIGTASPIIQYGRTVAGDPLWARTAAKANTEARGVIAYGVD